MIIKKEKLLQKALSSIREKRQISFIPTMGNFHKGHLSLINYANHNNQLVQIEASARLSAGQNDLISRHIDGIADRQKLMSGLIENIEDKLIDMS